MYKHFFGLRENPFNVNPDPRYLFLTSQTRGALGEITYGIRARKGLILLTGEVGTGKTTLINRLLDSLREKHTPTAFIFNSHLEANHLIDFIMADFRVPFDAGLKGGALLNLNQWLVERYRAGEAPVLIVDEAQGLPIHALEEIRMLLNLETPHEKLLQIILAGQPELEERLERPDLRQLKQRIMIRCKTGPLTLAETGDYIESRLQIAGRTGEQLFAPEAVNALHRYSSGIPRVVNLLCEHALINAYVDGLQQVPVQIIEEVAREFQYDAVSTRVASGVSVGTVDAPVDAECLTATDAPLRARAAVAGASREQGGWGAMGSAAARIAASTGTLGDLRQVAAPILNRDEPIFANGDKDALGSINMGTAGAIETELTPLTACQADTLTTFASDPYRQLVNELEEGRAQAVFSSGLHVVDAKTKFMSPADSGQHHVSRPQKAALSPGLAAAKAATSAVVRAARRDLLGAYYSMSRVSARWRKRLLSVSSAQVWREMTAPTLRDLHRSLRPVRSVYRRSVAWKKTWAGTGRPEWTELRKSAYRWLCEPWNPAPRRWLNSQALGMRRSLSQKKV